MGADEPRVGAARTFFRDARGTLWLPVAAVWNGLLLARDSWPMIVENLPLAGIGTAAIVFWSLGSAWRKAWGRQREAEESLRMARVGAREPAIILTVADLRDALACLREMMPKVQALWLEVDQLGGPREDEEEAGFAQLLAHYEDQARELRAAVRERLSQHASILLGGRMHARAIGITETPSTGWEHGKTLAGGIADLLERMRSLAVDLEQEIRRLTRLDTR